MPKNTQGKRYSCLFAFAACVFFVTAMPGTAATVTVDCSSPKAKAKSISEGLAKLPTIGPNLLLVSGTCHENIVIENYSNLTVQGNPSATIDGSGDPNAYALLIHRSSFVSANDLTIEGGWGTACGSGSTCMFSNDTFQNSGGVSFLAWTYGYVNLSTIQNNPSSDGLLLDNAATVFVLGSTIRDNGTDPACGSECGGIYLALGSMVRIQSSDATPTLIQNNTSAYGIRARAHSTLYVGPGTVVSGNGTDGIQLMEGSIAYVTHGVSVTNNTGRGIRIGDLGMVRFEPNVEVSGNSAGTDQVVCDGQFATTRGVGGIPTNCPAEPLPVP